MQQRVERSAKKPRRIGACRNARLMVRKAEWYLPGAGDWTPAGTTRGLTALVRRFPSPHGYVAG